ncbi:LysR family transcriptional regulator [Arthrobacter sp. GMC3]|uniref:LysR family transcriptional regulator n=1 Tax=Arthrobacter sp. GMC3 TaxID=2058894 RepID=UPI000CE2DF2D|nr:LysR family transcriptional regulator [Arthrobacter sp. GMC3]
MEIRLLRAFVEVAQQQNFGHAAAELSTTQSALTKQIQLLERQLGTVLFSRGRHGAALTAAGEALITDATELLQRADALERRMKRLAAGTEGLLTVGFGMSALEVAPRAVATFRARHPGVDISLEDMSSKAQAEAIRTGRLSVGFIRLPAPAGLASKVVHHDGLALAIPFGESTPRLSRQALASWLQARQLIRLIPARGPGLTAQTQQLFTDLGASPGVLQESSDLLTVLALVAAGVGSAVVSASTSAIVPDGVKVVPLDLDSARWSIGIAWLAESTDPLIPLFLRSLQSAETSP